MANIVAAASEEFSRRGYSDATTAQIARSADVTEAQLFRYFGSKANLYREVVFEPLTRHLRDFMARYPPEQMGDHYITDLQRFITDHAEMFRSLITVEQYNHDDITGVGSISNLTAYFESGEAGMHRGLPPDARVAPRLMVRISFAAVLACVLFKDWIFPPGFASEEELTAAINDFVMDGIAASWRSRSG